MPREFHIEVNVSACLSMQSLTGIVLYKLYNNKLDNNKRGGESQNQEVAKAHTTQTPEQSSTS